MAGVYMRAPSRGGSTETAWKNTAIHPDHDKPTKSDFNMIVEMCGGGKRGVDKKGWMGKMDECGTRSEGSASIFYETKHQSSPVIC